MEKEKKTGLPDGLRATMESLSEDMDKVKVHIDSDLPKELGTLVHVQGTGIRITPGQEERLSHESWEVVQQSKVQARSRKKLKDIAENEIKVEDRA